MENKVVGDLLSARRVEIGSSDQPSVTDYIAWLDIKKDHMDDKHQVTSKIQRLTFATAGYLKNNEDIFSLTKKLIISLIGTKNIEEIVSLLEKSFETDFGAKSSRVVFFTEYPKNLPKKRVKNLSKANKLLRNVIKPGEIYCGAIEEDLARFIFDRKSIVAECALAPLNCNTLKGLIALGTDIPKKYDGNKDTLFLDFVSEVVSKLIDSHNV